MSKLKVRCPNPVCNSLLAFDLLTSEGSSVECPKCGKIFPIHTPAERSRSIPLPKMPPLDPFGSTEVAPSPLSAKPKPRKAEPEEESDGSLKHWLFLGLGMMLTLFGILFIEIVAKNGFAQTIGIASNRYGKNFEEERIALKSEIDSMHAVLQKEQADHQQNDVKTLEQLRTVQLEQQMTIQKMEASYEEERKKLREELLALDLERRRLEEKLLGPKNDLGPKVVVPKEIPKPLPASGIVIVHAADLVPDRIDGVKSNNLTLSFDAATVRLPNFDKVSKESLGYLSSNKNVKGEIEFSYGTKADTVPFAILSILNKNILTLTFRERTRILRTTAAAAATATTGTLLLPIVLTVRTHLEEIDVRRGGLRSAHAVVVGRASVV